MTYLEKAKELRPDLTEEVLLDDKCPYHLKLEPFYKCGAYSYDDCFICWNREMPEVKGE